MTSTVSSSSSRRPGTGCRSFPAPLCFPPSKRAGRPFCGLSRCCRPGIPSRLLQRLQGLQIYISNRTRPSLKQNTSGCLKTMAAMTFPSSGLPLRLCTSPRSSSSRAICSVFIPCWLVARRYTMASSIFTVPASYTDLHKYTKKNRLSHPWFRRMQL